MSERAPIAIDVVSDVVCPWCYIGMQRLARALDATPDVGVEVRWRPYQLDPTIPPEGRERKAYMLAKFGSEARLSQIHRNVEAAGREAGIDFAFDQIKVSPNTLDAHRVIRWAASEGPRVQSALVKRLFAMYFEEGCDVGDRQVLAGAAAEAGMDRPVVEALFASGADTDEVRAEIETAGRMGVRGVPCFLIEGRYAIMGAQDPSVIADAIVKVSEAKARGELDAPAGG